MKELFVDLETTGLDSKKSAIHQLAALVVIDGTTREKVILELRPFEGAEISSEALEVGGITMEDLMSPSRLSEKQAYNSLIKIMSKYVNKFDKTDKFHLIGYNLQSFDSAFIRSMFERQGDKFYGSWFWWPHIDVMLIAAQILKKERSKMINFKLGTVCAKCGVVVDETKQHDAMYDIEITRELYKNLVEEEEK